ncbi:MAG: hypothetical protein P1U77_03535 [Rubripirellula sp.]|nr:hypothetical protein [Rubripirellula sp.]
MRVRKTHSLGCHLVEVGHPEFTLNSKASWLPVANVVKEHEDNIGLIGVIFRGRMGGAYQNEQGRYGKPCHVLSGGLRVQSTVVATAADSGDRHTEQRYSRR